jgi:hypothetical protein
MKIKDVHDLENITSEIIKVIEKHIENTHDTPSGVAKKIGIHPLQLLGFLRGERGIHITTVERIGKNIKNYEKNLKKLEQEK